MRSAWPTGTCRCRSCAVPTGRHARCSGWRDALPGCARIFARPTRRSCTARRVPHCLAAPVARTSRVPHVFGHVHEIWRRSDTLALAGPASACHQLLAISHAVADSLPKRLRRRATIVPNGTADPGAADHPPRPVGRRTDLRRRQPVERLEGPRNTAAGMGPGRERPAAGARRSAAERWQHRRPRPGRTTEPPGVGRAGRRGRRLGGVPRARRRRRGALRRTGAVRSGHHRGVRPRPPGGGERCRRCAGHRHRRRRRLAVPAPRRRRAGRDPRPPRPRRGRPRRISRPATFEQRYTAQTYARAWLAAVGLNR